MRNGSGAYSLPVNTWNPATNGVSATASDWQSLIDDVATALTASLAADGQTPMTGNLAMGNNKLTGLAAGTAAGNSLRWEQLFSQGVEVDIASATTTDIGAQNTNFLRITGTTTIDSFGTNYNGPRFMRFAASLTLTHNATTLILPGGANIITAAGDQLVAYPKGNAGTPNGWRVFYQKASGLPVSTAGLAASGDVTASGLTMTTARMLGRTTGGTGAIEELTAANVSAFAAAASTTAQGVAELATTAETQTGTDTGRVVTPAGLRGALGVSTSFESTNQTVTPASSLTVAHGLGVVPKLFHVVLKCTSAELNYSVGDEVACNFNFVSGVSVIQASADATNVVINYSGASTSVLNKTTQAQSAITSAKWAFVVRAWA